MGNAKYAALLIPFALTLAFFLNPTFLSFKPSPVYRASGADEKLLSSGKKILLSTVRDSSGRRATGSSAQTSGVTTAVDDGGRVDHYPHTLYEWYNGNWRKIIVDGTASGHDLKNKPAVHTSEIGRLLPTVRRSSSKSNKVKGKRGKKRGPKGRKSNKKGKSPSNKPNKRKRNKNKKQKRKSQKKPTSKFQKKKLPTTCNCKLGAQGEGHCYFYTEENSDYCAARYCSAQYVCVARNKYTGTTCLLRKVTSKIVPTGVNTCKTKRVNSFVYVPYAE